MLAPDFIVLAASEYSVFEEFVATFQGILDIVGTETQVALSDRIGLRYVDLIRLRPGESFREYLDPGLHGLDAGALEASSVIQQTQIEAAREMGSLVVRLWQAKDGRFLPPDLGGEDVTFKVALDVGELVTILDIDHFSIQERDFDPPRLVEDMWRLHNGLDRAFRAVVTQTALGRWGAELLSGEKHAD